MGLGVLVSSELLGACSKTATSLAKRTSRSTSVLSVHEAEVVEEATARLIPGPTDDPSDPDPGAREANVTRYIDTMLGALSLVEPPIYGGGPFSDRGGSPVDDFSHFLRLTPVQYAAWSKRLAGFRASYTEGVKALDRLSGGDFTKASAASRDHALVTDPGGFTALLFTHAIEGMYAAPEYGGNAGTIGWQSIGFAGDTQPRGYEPAEVSNSDGPDPYVASELSTKVLNLLQAQ
jgi:Gluconate 2-dehydrogenase subunit 3